MRDALAAIVEVMQEGANRQRFALALLALSSVFALLAGFAIGTALVLELV